MNAVAYLRVSSKEQAEEGYSLEAQRLACQQYAEEKGLKVIRIFEDRGESGTSLDRAGFQEMLESLESGTSVIVHKLDRFGRSLDDYVSVRAELRRRGVKILSVSENLDDSVSGVLVENVLASISDWYSRNLSVETRKGKNQKAKQGWYPSVAPIGYLNRDGVIVLDEEKAPLVRQAFELYASGDYTLKSLREAITLRGLKGKGGKPLALSRIAAILANPFYTGRFVWGGIEMDGRHEPIVPTDLFVQVTKLLAANNRGRMHARVNDHYLKGLLYCSCGRKLTLTIAKGKFPYFFCLGRDKCSQPYISVEDAERQVEELYEQIRAPGSALHEIEREMLLEIEAKDANRHRMAKTLTQRLQKLAREREKLMAAYLADAVPVELLKREQDRITAESALIEGQMATLTERIAKAKELVQIGLKLLVDCRGSYLAASSDVRRKWNGAVFAKIVIKGRRVSRVFYREPFASLFLSDGSIQLRSRRRTGIEPACQLSPAHRF